ncbi:3-methyladenine DNA glycosylase AlkD [Kribbella voronezhensis]|uniref:3-methyladenine DNA glycosylase AlkD n=1 Tax=Kribbella voronezhensis TaxID=2512212 RepID=A0A4R7TAX5_9ACTN|nr:DNA alkylation repair protein [Kribbella voronezhensis]TDU89161.1 3-methyladenine DNA glycosylase AlkD [Kribbella voronezhensis]
MTVDELLSAIDDAADPAVAEVLARYFQLQPGGYGFGDRMIGVKLSTLRGLLKPYVRAGLPLPDLEKALASPVHEHRLAVLALLADRASLALKPRTANPAELAEIYHLYLRNTAHIDNWDLVDCSAPQIVGGHLLDKPRDPLYKLIASSNIWERRIALIATQRLIGAGQTADTYQLAALVLTDSEDLIHKASGWMLREAGKRVSADELLAFLDQYAATMPRTMLRYAIERLPTDVRKHYLTLKKARFVDKSAGDA